MRGGGAGPRHERAGPSSVPQAEGYGRGAGRVVRGGGAPRTNGSSEHRARAPCRTARSSRVRWRGGGRTPSRTARRPQGGDRERDKRERGAASEERYAPGGDCATLPGPWLRHGAQPGLRWCIWFSEHRSRHRRACRSRDRTRSLSARGGRRRAARNHLRDPPRHSRFPVPARPLAAAGTPEELERLRGELDRLSV